MRSPCLKCDLLHTNKATDTCELCEDRIVYARDQRMIPQGNEMDGLRKEGTVKELEQVEEKVKKKRGRPCKVVKPEMEIRQGSIENATQQKKPRTSLKLSFESDPVVGAWIMEELKKIAKSQLRSVSAQALFVLRDYIAEWKLINKP